ncbi:fungal-specific transcription factor domain-containing protein [Aspergillus varians]
MSSWHSRAKKKTFTGCWTCRERKVKCDEGRPRCQQCIGKGFECKGYALRLQWLAPLTASGYSPKVPTVGDSVGSISNRRVMFCEPPRTVLSDRKLDSLLLQIEADAPTSGPFTVACGPFAAFTAVQTETGTETNTGQEGNVSCCDGLTRTLYTLAGFEARSGQCSEISVDDFLQSLTQSPDPTSPTCSPVGVPLLAIHGTNSEPESWNSSSLSSSESPAVFTPSRVPGSPDETTDISSVTTSPTPPNPFQVPDQVKYLLNHYTTDILDLMTVVPTPKCPWKTVHLPRALQGCGELAFRGTTSHARNALLHAVLTISAYNLASGQALDACSWREVALNHTSRSLTYLKASLQPGCPVLEKGKYKEILAAMLSMVTIEVCSGDTNSCEWHLRGIEDFIRTSQRKPGRRYSRKAQALHRDYVYLRIMREATDLRCAALDASLDPSSEAMTAWLCRPLCFLDSINAPDVWLQDDSDPGSSVDYSACEFVYGIPLQLLVLASKSSQLIRRKRTFARHYPCSVAPAPFLTMCDDLELQVLKWPVDRMVGGIDKLPIAEELKGLITHQTRAFHQAVIIYFSRLVRGVHRRHLQPYAESIIDHLEAVERIKYEANLTTSCISWPGFVGAAEAMAEALRSRYLQWSRSVRFYDLGVYDKATKVILEVWERDKTDKGLAPVCDWPTITEAEDIRLMLV